MTATEDFPEFEEDGSEPARIAYIKPTRSEDARKLGIVPPGIQLPPNATLYVLHSTDGNVLGYMDSWDGAYGAAVQNEFMPVAVH